MSLAAAYTCMIPLVLSMVFLESTAHIDDDLASDIVIIIFSVFLVVPTWFMTFLPFVIMAHPRSFWVRPGFLGTIGAAVGFAWGLMIADGDGLFFITLVLCGVTPGATYGIWNRRYIGRDSFA